MDLLYSNDIEIRVVTGTKKYDTSKMIISEARPPPPVGVATGGSDLMSSNDGGHLVRQHVVDELK